MSASSRLELFQTEIFRVEDRKKRRFILSPTSEELVSALLLRRYLPVGERLSLYARGKKFRDDLGGGSVSRAREFTMVEMYTLHPDETDMLAWSERVSDVVSRSLEALGVHARVGESRVSATSRFSGHRSLEFRVPSAVRTGVFDEHGQSLLEVARWTPLGDTYLPAGRGCMSCLGIGSIRILLHLYEVLADGRPFEEVQEVFWPDSVMPVRTAIVLPSARSRYSGSERCLLELYDRRVSRGDVILDDRCWLDYKLRLRQLRRIGVRTIVHSAGESGVVVRDACGKAVARGGIGVAEDVLLRMETTVSA